MAMNATVRAPYDLNDDGFNETILYFNPRLNLRITDNDHDGIGDYFSIETSDKSIDLDLNKRNLTLVAFSPFRKTVLTYKISQPWRLELITASVSSIPQQHWAGELCSEAGNGNLEYIPKKPIIDAAFDSSLGKIQSKTCSVNQSEIIKQQLKVIFAKSDLSELRTSIGSACLQKISRAKVDVAKTYSQLRQKIEMIKHGTSFLNIECSEKNSKICENFRATSFPYPDTIVFCFPKGPRADLKGILNYQLLMHELLHSKGIELTETQITALNECIRYQASPLFSNIAADDKVNQASKEEVAATAFKPGKEYQTLKVPPPPSGALAQSIFKQTGSAATGAVAVGNSEPNWRWAQGMVGIANQVFSNIVPPALADESTSRGSSANPENFGGSEKMPPAAGSKKDPDSASGGQDADHRSSSTAAALSLLENNSRGGPDSVGNNSDYGTSPNGSGSGLDHSGSSPSLGNPTALSGSGRAPSANSRGSASSTSAPPSSATARQGAPPAQAAREPGGPTAANNLNGTASNRGGSGTQGDGNLPNTKEAKTSSNVNAGNGGSSVAGVDSRAIPENRNKGDKLTESSGNSGTAGSSRAPNSTTPGGLGTRDPSSKATASNSSLGPEKSLNRNNQSNRSSIGNAKVYAIVNQLKDRRASEVSKILTNPANVEKLSQHGITVYLLKNPDRNEKTPYGANPENSKVKLEEDNQGIIRLTQSDSLEDRSIVR